MSGFLVNFSKLTRKIFSLPSNIIERTVPEIQVNYKKICNGYSSSCKLPTAKVEMPDIFSKNNDLHIKQISPVTKIIATPNFPDSSQIGAVTWIKHPHDEVNLYDVIMKIETDKSFVYVSAPSDGTIAELLVADGATVKPGQELVKFVSTNVAKKDASKISPPLSKKTGKIIAAPQFPDGSATGIVKWIQKTQNAQVDAYEIILRIETDNAFIYVPAPASGTIVNLLVNDGDRIRPGQNLFQFDLKTSFFRFQKSKRNIPPPTKAPSTNKDLRFYDRTKISPEQQPRSMKSNDPYTSPSTNKDLRFFDPIKISSEQQPRSMKSNDPYTSPSTNKDLASHDPIKISPEQQPRSMKSNDLYTSPSTNKDLASHDPIKISPEQQPRSMKSNDPYTSPSTNKDLASHDPIKIAPAQQPRSMKSNDPYTSPSTNKDLRFYDRTKISPEQQPRSMKSNDPYTSPSTNKDLRFYDRTKISPEQQPRSMKSNDPYTSPSTNKDLRFFDRIKISSEQQPRSLNTNSNSSVYRTNVNYLGSKKAPDMLTTLNEIDMGNIILWRKHNLKACQQQYITKFGIMALFCKACANALKEFPDFNAYMYGDEIVYHNYADISVAVPSTKGYVLPVLRNVEKMKCADIAKQIETISSKAKTGVLGAEEQKCRTFTITNAGKFGGLMDIIAPPTYTVLGMHGIFNIPVAYKGKIDIRPMMHVALTYDHRIVNGHAASSFLSKVKASIEEPTKIVAARVR